MVDKLEIPTGNRPHPYKLEWFNKSNKVKFVKRCLVKFSISPIYQDNIWGDVIPMDACHLLLGRQWQYDCCALCDGYANTYSFVKDGVKVKRTPLPPYEINESKKKSTSLVSLVTK